jgi:hypothetical protein
MGALGFSHILILVVAGFILWRVFRSRNAVRPMQGSEARVQDMMPCQICGAYVAMRQGTSCGKPNCPY